MNLKDKILAAKTAFQIKFLGKKAPLIVTWPITNRCNFRCKYCERWKRKIPELLTKQIFSIIDQLQNLGTKGISLSGGEPLIRDDIGKIINYAYQKGISCVVTSNGCLVSQKIKKLKNLALLKLSIEGEERVHDWLREKGSFKKVLEAAKVAQEHNMKFVFNSVLTSFNLDQIDFLLDLAERYKTGVRFTALNTAHAGKEQIKFLYPKDKAYKRTIDKLIKAKKKGRPVFNSFSGLNYLRSWPRPRPLKCFAGRAFAHLSSNGDLYPCVVMEGKVKPKSILKLGFKEAFENLPKAKCSGCWCGGTLEFNLLLGLKSWI